MTTKDEIEQIEQMLAYARHTHVNSQDGTDACKKCGHDLRHKIHVRDTPDKPVADLLTTILEKVLEDLEMIEGRTFSIPNGKTDGYLIDTEPKTTPQGVTEE